MKLPNYRNKRTGFLIAGGVVIIIGLISIAQTLSSVVVHEPDPLCLTDTQEAYYTVVKKDRPDVITVSVRDTSASSTIWTSKHITVPNINNVSFFRSGKCYFYLHQSFNYDYENAKAMPGYTYEIWRFPYLNSEGGKRVVLNETTKDGSLSNLEDYYSSYFRVDPLDQYIALEKSHTGEPDYALVIKDIATGDEVYELKLRDVTAQYPRVYGSFDPIQWETNPQGTFLRGEIYDGSRWLAFFNLNTDTWEIEILPTPEDYYAGVERAGTIRGGYLAYTDMVVWTGLDITYDAVTEEQVQSGKPKNLMVANLRTGEIRTIESVPFDPDHRFKLNWTNDTTLQYTLPDGKTRTYPVPF